MALTNRRLTEDFDLGPSLGAFLVVAAPGWRCETLTTLVVLLLSGWLRSPEPASRQVREDGPPLEFYDARTSIEGPSSLPRVTSRGMTGALYGQREMQVNDVPAAMTRVKTILTCAERNRQAAGTVFIHGAGGDDIGIARLRGHADVAIEFPSGSDRPVIGPALRLGKRVVRRGLRWYIGPITGQQNRVNHMMLDVMERLRLENERLTCEVEALGRLLEERPPEAMPPPTAG